jgi:hypothetical protein
MSNIMNYLDNLLTEKKMWSGEVKTHWTPPEGFFTQSAEKIAKGLKRASENLKQASARLTFYRNRSGKNLSAEDKARLKLAAEKLHTLYECNMNESTGKMVTLTRDIMGREPHTHHKLIYKKGTKVKVIPASNLPNYKEEKLFWVNDPKEPEGGAGTLLTPDDFSECVVREAKATAPYVVMGQLGSRAPERLDTADNEHNAEYLVGEYKMAFGPKWKIWKAIDRK